MSSKTMKRSFIPYVIEHANISYVILETLQNLLGKKNGVELVISELKKEATNARKRGNLPEAEELSTLRGLVETLNV